MTGTFDYIIVGSGLAGASAVEGIRENDQHGTILMIGREPDYPYHRPPLSKELWFGKKKIQDIFVHHKEFYDKNVSLFLFHTAVTALDRHARTIKCGNGNSYHYGKLLLATGGMPRRLSILGADDEEIFYYRTLVDYNFLREKAKAGSSAVVIGGGFIGSELAAALNANHVDVTMVFPEKYLVERMFPESLGRAIQKRYEDRGIKFLTEDSPRSIERRMNGSLKFITQTEKGARIESDIVVVGAGIVPAIDLARAAGLDCGDGIVVDEFLQTSDPHIFAAGDNAFFPYRALNKSTRVEHWDNALNQGKFAGRNMAGARVAYDYMPFFFSDLFDFGYEAVGDVSTKLVTVTDWQKENDTGFVYYLQDGIIKGVMTCNIFGKVDWARDLIKRGERVRPRQQEAPASP